MHIHLYKCAGTSVDEVLARNFGGALRSIEFSGHRHDEEFRQVVADDRSMAALSSHTLMTVPAIAGVEILPIIFLRHPIDRLKSAYDFRRGEEIETYETRLAKQAGFAAYLETLWDLERHPDRGAEHRSIYSDPQAFRLSRLASVTAAERREAAAFAALDALPFVGLVEAFEGSMRRLEVLARRLYPEFRWHAASANRRRGGTLDERLASIRREVGDAFYRRIEANNAIDMALYGELCRRYCVAAGGTT